MKAIKLNRKVYTGKARLTGVGGLCLFLLLKGGKIDGYKGNGVLVMSVDNLPCELPKESSTSFSNSLINFIPDIAKADYSVDFQRLNIPEEIKKAVVLHHGKLTPDYQYIKGFL